VIASLTLKDPYRIALLVIVQEYKLTLDLLVRYIPPQVVLIDPQVIESLVIASLTLIDS
jgi:hypothetical protein